MTRLCEERRWISGFLGVGRVNSAIMFVRLACFRPFSSLAVGLEVQFSTPRTGAVFYYYYFNVADRLPDLQPSAAELSRCLPKLYLFM